MNPARSQNTKQTYKNHLFLMLEMNVLIKIKNTILFAIALKIKYLGVNPIKYVQNLCAENHKTAMKEITEVKGEAHRTHRPKDSGHKEVNTPQTHTQALHNSHQISVGLFEDIGKIILDCI